MTHGRLFFLEIETVPDREVLPGDFAEDAFPPKPIQHRVVAISFVSAALEREGRFEHYTVEECRSGGDVTSSEEQLLRGFWHRFERDKAEVREMVARGDLASVRAYCESDVLNLFVLYVRWAYLTGRVDAAGHNAALDSLIDYLEQQRPVRPHLGAFLDGWRSSTRPAPMHVPVPFIERTPAAAGIEHLRSEDVLGVADAGGAG